jgi:hypothetical protein
MSCRTVLLAAVSASLFGCSAAVASELPTGRWYKVDGYTCRAFRDVVDDKPSVIGTHRNVSQRACAVLCNGTPNCAAYNYLVRIERAGGRPQPVQDCQLLSRANGRVTTISLKPGESAFVCYKSPPDSFDRPDLDAGGPNHFQDSTRPNIPTTPPAPPPRND